MVFILFRNILFIPFLNIWRDFDDDDDEDSDNDEKANSCAIKIVLKITFEYNRYKKNYWGRDNKPIANRLPENIDSLTDTTKLTESIV